MIRFALPAVLAALLLTPAAASAQSAPASWETPDGRWSDWKAGNFATSEAHFKALKAAAAKAPAKAALPSWPGLWTSATLTDPSLRPAGWGTVRYENAPGAPVRPPPPGSPPPPKGAEIEVPVLTPAYQKKLEAELDRVAKGHEWDYLSACLPAGYPRWHTEPFLREFIVTQDQTWMINEMMSEVRRIYTDGRDHRPEDERFPLFEGDSIGFWDGDVLVIHTISVKPGTWNRSQPAYSDQTETVEQVRLNKDGKMEFRLTVYDPESLQKPWHAIFGSLKVDQAKTPGLRIDMWACTENNNVVQTADGGSTFILPGEKGYKDPDTQSKAPD